MENDAFRHERDQWQALAAAADADKRKAEAIAAEQAGEIERLRSEMSARPKQWWLPWAPVEAARRMHLAYEHFASDFGYETRADTKVWNPDSANGQLMTAVIRNVFIEQAADAALKEQK
jgi:hypothetical protein